MDDALVRWLRMHVSIGGWLFVVACSSYAWLGVARSPPPPISRTANTATPVPGSPAGASSHSYVRSRAAAKRLPGNANVSNVAPKHFRQSLPCRTPAGITAALLAAALVLIQAMSHPHITEARIGLDGDNLRFEDGFPSRCTAPQGCIRITNLLPYNCDPMCEPAVIEGTPAAIQAGIMEWLSNRFQTTVVSPSTTGLAAKHMGPNKQGYYTHAVTLTAFWGFVDDTGVQISGLNATHSHVELMGQLRLGVYDFGVNKARIQALYEYVTRHALGTGFN